MKLELKGGVYGKRAVKLKKPDIIKSVVRRRICEINTVTLKKTKNRVSIYHTFESQKNDFKGRWYNTDLLQKGTFSMDDAKFLFTFILPEWEMENSGKIVKDVPVKIYFTEEGWTKFRSMVHAPPRTTFTWW